MACRLPSRVLVMIICIVLLSSSLSAQTWSDSSEARIDDENFLDHIETESDQSELLDRLTWLKEHPLDLNTASKEELSTIPGLTISHVNTVLRVRREKKAFMSVSELGSIPDVGEDILQISRPYLYVARDENSTVGGFVSFTSRIVRDLQPRRGFLDSSFLGTSLKTYNRFSLSQNGTFHAGALFEKDAGEQLGNGFLSGFVAVQDWSIISRLIVGDFVVESGQGLTLWRSSAFGKGSEAVSSVKKTGLGAQPYRSADEFNFMRGVALSSVVSLGENSLTLTALYSRRGLSATGSDTSITGFNEDGLLRTQTDLRQESNVVERIVGGRLQFRSSTDWNVGSTFYQSRFSKPIFSEGVFDFNGVTANAVGVDAEFNLSTLSRAFSGVTLFGEFSRSNGGSAGVIGSSLSISRGTNVAIIYRDYSPRFISFHAAGFGERSETTNERGFYLGVDARVNPMLRVSGYLDHFRFPWRTFANPLPTSGRDALFQADIKPTKAFEFTLRYGNKSTETTEGGADSLLRETRLLADRRQQKFRLTATFRPSRQIRLRGRIERTMVKYPSTQRSESGLLVYHEVQYSLPLNFSAETRLVFFDTDSYDSRLYEYENDLRGVFSNPALYGKGRRWYLLVRWKALERVNVSAKYSETQFEGVKSIGSGSTMIHGDLDNRFALQIDIRF